MGAKMITITKQTKKGGVREAQVVETSLRVWKERGWSVKGEKSEEKDEKPADTNQTPQKKTGASGN